MKLFNYLKTLININQASDSSTNVKFRKYKKGLFFGYMKTKPTNVDVQEKKSFYDVLIHLIYCHDIMILF
jgi:hypothetical protein